MKKTISGIRGIVGQDFGLRDVIGFCTGFSNLIESGRCVIATDTRPSGAMIKNMVAAALMYNGIDVLDLGMAPTPVVFYEARKHGAGVMISSSHNPLEWNGLKFVIGGRGINADELQTVLTQTNSQKTAIGSECKITTDYIDAAQKLAGSMDGSPNVIVDIGGGAAKHVAAKFLRKLGCTVTTINDSLKESSRGPDPTADDLSDLVSYNDADVGFAFDLDGDRLVLVRHGKKQSPDTTLGLGVAKALALGYKKFVLSIDTSMAVEHIIKQAGGQVLRSKVGEANVVDLLLKTESQAGGEGSSAGFILPEFNLCRDGILASGLIASMLGDNKFDKILSFMDNYIQSRDKVSADSKLHDETLKIVAAKMSKIYDTVTLLDGVRGEDKDSWVLVRKSNTEDVIRISAESTSQKKTDAMMSETKKLIVESYEKCANR